MAQRSCALVIAKFELQAEVVDDTHLVIGISVRHPLAYPRALSGSRRCSESADEELQAMAKFISDGPVRNSP